MGSVPSSPNGDRETSDDPWWWPIEHENLSLEQSPLLYQIDTNYNSNNRNMDQNSEGQKCPDPDRSDQNSCATAATSAANNNNMNNNQNCDQNQCESEKVHGLDQVTSNKVLEKIEAHIIRSKEELKKEQSMDEFEEEMRVKRERRLNAVTNLRNDLQKLREQLAEQKEINKRLQLQQSVQCENCKKHQNEARCQRSTVDENVDGNVERMQFDNNSGDCSSYDRSSDIHLKAELAKLQLSLQLATGDVLTLTTELQGTQKQVTKLKEVVVVTKQMIAMRDEHLNELKGKLKEIEDSLAERELKMMSDNLRQEYDRQLTNIRNLRTLYEERARVNAAERENLIRQLDTKRTEYDAEVEKNSILQERITEFEKDFENTTNDLNTTKTSLSKYRVESKELQEQMTVINELFSQLLMGFSGGNDINIDKLSNMLEENRDLLNDITKRETSKEGAAAIPKLLFDLVTESKNENHEAAATDVVNEDEAIGTDLKQSDCDIFKTGITSAQEIIHNLPKVWKVLIELLNHQKAEKVNFMENGQSEDCYNAIQTPSGPQLVLSVSKTYIKLKDLILEKKFLQKETHKLKNLNTHLEKRLNQQENRLSAVTIELNKTWSLVGRMQRQHRQLHTHEQVLRYQLQQKRRILNELKDELEYCRRKWALARAKNDESQSQWNTLRLEFSKRKLQDSNNSGESGYSDDHLSDDDENSDEELLHVENMKSLKAELMAPISGNPKYARTQSVSPIRRDMDMIQIKRGNSAPPVAEIVSEVYQTATEIAPMDIEPQILEQKTIPNMDSNLLYAASSSVVASNIIEKIKCIKQHTESPQVTINSKNSDLKPVGPSSPALSSLISPSTGARPKLCSEIRKKIKSNEIKKPNNEESLEEMFLRISGEPEIKSTETSNSNEEDEEVIDEVLKVINDDEERRALRSVRFQRLEEQCQELISKVVKTSIKENDINTQANECKTETDTQLNSFKSNSNQVCVDEACALELTSKNEFNSENNESVLVPQQEPQAGNQECLSIHEQEYTSKRSERLKRLEAECKAFLERANQRKNTAIEMNNKVDKLHQRYSKDSIGGIEPSANLSLGTVDQVQSISQNNFNQNTSTTIVKELHSDSNLSLTQTEQEYLERRAARLQRLEDESAQLLNRVNRSVNRATSIGNKLDRLHEQYSVVSDTSTISTTKNCDETEVVLSENLYHSSNNGNIIENQLEGRNEQCIDDSIDVGLATGIDATTESSNKTSSIEDASIFVQESTDVDNSNTSNSNTTEN